MSVSLDGCFEGLNGEIDWHLVDAEFNAYAVQTLEAADLLIMGRGTYELMDAYWPAATDNDPVVKDKLNGLPKLVFSKHRVSRRHQALSAHAAVDQNIQIRKRAFDIPTGIALTRIRILQRGLRIHLQTHAADVFRELRRLRQL